jgi:hypothetical protein
MYKKIFIYGLYDVKNNIIRYIGKSVNVEKRYRSHLSETNRVKNHKNDWINSVKKSGSKLGFTILDICNESDWKEKEREWIIKLRKENDLVNYTDGGDGDQTNRFTMSYDELKDWVIKNKPKYVNSISTYTKWVRSDNVPFFLPKSPKNVYEKYGWVNWGDFLGTGNIKSIDLTKNYISYDECKKWVIDNLNDIVSRDKWINNYQNNGLPNFIPKKPDRFYKNKGWTNWNDFLGTEKKTFLSYEESKKWINENYGQINYTEFKKLQDTNMLPNFIPKKPHNTYNEFKSWFDFLGGKSKRNKNDYLSFNDAKNIVHSLKIKTNKEWKNFIKNNTLKLKIPTNPDYTYKKDWISWYDWLGK